MRRGRVYDDSGKLATLDAAGPCSPNQWGRLRRECERLGVEDRAERLYLVAGMAGRPGLASTRDLDAGTAGRVVRMLAGCRTVADAYRLADADKRAAQWAKVWAQFMRQLTEGITADADR
jgi:hypothetical protein